MVEAASVRVCGGDGGGGGGRGGGLIKSHHLAFAQPSKGHL